MATKAKQAKQSLVITVSGDRGINEVSDDLKAAGVEVEQILETIGVVTGTAHARNVARLRRIRGVTDVSPGHDVDIGPPGSPVS